MSNAPTTVTPGLTITTDTGTITGPVAIIAELAQHMASMGIEFTVTK